MYSRYTIIVSSFPQTANGKLDRNSLPHHHTTNEIPVIIAANSISGAEERGARFTMTDHICNIVAHVKVLRLLS